MKKIIITVIGCALIAGTSFANPYVSGKIGVADFVVDTDQYMYHTPDAYRSTIVDGRIDDINAAYRAAIGWRFGNLRIEA